MNSFCVLFKAKTNFFSIFFPFSTQLLLPFHHSALTHQSDLLPICIPDFLFFHQPLGNKQESPDLLLFSHAGVLFCFEKALLMRRSQPPSFFSSLGSVGLYRKHQGYVSRRHTTHAGDSPRTDLKCDRTIFTEEKTHEPGIVFFLESVWCLMFDVFGGFERRLSGASCTTRQHNL